MILLVFGMVLLSGLALVVHGTLWALRAEHLLLLYWGTDVGLFVLAKNEKRRYELVPAWTVPAVALQFTASKVLERLRRGRPVLAPAPATPPTHRFARLART